MKWNGPVWISRVLILLWWRNQHIIDVLYAVWHIKNKILQRCDCSFMSEHTSPVLFTFCCKCLCVGCVLYELTVFICTHSTHQSTERPALGLRVWLQNTWYTSYTQLISVKKKQKTSSSRGNLQSTDTTRSQRTKMPVKIRNLRKYSYNLWSSTLAGKAGVWVNCPLNWNELQEDFTIRLTQSKGSYCQTAVQWRKQTCSVHIRSVLGVYGFSLRSSWERSVSFTYSDHDVYCTMFSLGHLLVIC